MNGAMWSLITVLGPLLLIAAIVWAVLRNRNRAGVDRAERGARELRQELEDEEARRDAP